MNGRAAGRHLGLVSAVFCTVLAVSNLLALKPLQIPWFPEVQMDGGNLLFPLSYIAGDLLVEVYGYRAARRVIWTGFALNLLVGGVFSLAAWLPPAPGWEEWNGAFRHFYLQEPRIVAGSAAAFWCGSFVNAWIMSRLKVKMEGRHLWVRTLGSTVVGEALDSAIFGVAAFGGVWGWGLLGRVIVWNFVLKTGYEAVLTPATYWCARKLKDAEGGEAYDVGERLSPFG